MKYHGGEAQFTLASGAVPPLTAESINLNTATENRERVQANISEVQGRKKIIALEDHFNLRITDEAQ